MVKQVKWVARLHDLMYLGTAGSIVHAAEAKQPLTLKVNHGWLMGEILAERAGQGSR